MELRARQRRELQFYSEKKIELEKKLSMLSRDLQLTEHILKLIEREHRDELSIQRPK